MHKTYRATVTIDCEVTIDTDAVTGLDALDPARMEGIYDLQDRDEMLNHLAFNSVMNGTRDASRLDGWVDLPRDAVITVPDRWSFEATLWEEA